DPHQRRLGTHVASARGGAVAGAGGAGYPSHRARDRRAAVPSQNGVGRGRSGPRRSLRALVRQHDDRPQDILRIQERVAALLPRPTGPDAPCFAVLSTVERGQEWGMEDGGWGSGGPVVDFGYRRATI